MARATGFTPRARPSGRQEKGAAVRLVDRTRRRSLALGAAAVVVGLVWRSGAGGPARAAPDGLQPPVPGLARAAGTGRLYLPRGLRNATLIPTLVLTTATAVTDGAAAVVDGRTITSQMRASAGAPLAVTIASGLKAELMAAVGEDSKLQDKSAIVVLKSVDELPPGTPHGDVSSYLPSRDVYVRAGSLGFGRGDNEADLYFIPDANAPFSDGGFMDGGYSPSGHWSDGFRNGLLRTYANTIILGGKQGSGPLSAKWNAMLATPGRNPLLVSTR